MKNGKYQGRQEAKASSCGQKRIHLNGRLTAMVIATVMLLALAIGGTVAWLSTKSAPITNTFTPSKVACEVQEGFNSTTGEKTNVNVKNTGDIDAFVRVKLVTYRTNDAGEHIGGTVELPEFTPGTGWVKYDDYYYYTKPVEPNRMPEADLIDRITLKKDCSGVDGGHQAIDVMAEAIQSVPQDAVQAAWGLSIKSDGSLNVPSN